MELVVYGEGDIALTEALETNSEVMRELGGPLKPEEIPDTHRKRMGRGREGDSWFKVVPEPGGPAAGTIGIWPTELDGEPAYEAGWMLLPEFQGRGIASQALALLLEKARAWPAVGAVHAFPGESNPASNALCRKFGFELVGTEDGGYAGREFRINHWVLDTSGGSTSGRRRAG